MTPEFPITKDELAEAKGMLAAGKSLAEVSEWLGSDAGQLDLALWEDDGRTGPTPYAKAIARVPRFGE